MKAFFFMSSMHVTCSHLFFFLCRSPLSSLSSFSVCLRFSLFSPLLLPIIQPTWDALDNKAVMSQSHPINQLFLLYSQLGTALHSRSISLDGLQEVFGQRLCIKSGSGKWAYGAQRAAPSTVHTHAQRRLHHSVLSAKNTDTCLLTHTPTQRLIDMYNITQQEISRVPI